MRKFRILPILLIIAFAFLAFVAISKLQKKQDLEQKLENQNLVYFPKIEFENLYSSSIKDKLTNEDFKGRKYYIINVFASWCTTCLLEHENLWQISRNSNVKLFGIAFHDVDENTKEYLAKNGNPFFKVAVDRKGKLTRLLAVSGVPETFIIDNDGKIVRRFRGNLPNFDAGFFDKDL